jgi:hypothetical protein
MSTQDSNQAQQMPNPLASDRRITHALVADAGPAPMLGHRALVVFSFGAVILVVSIAFTIVAIFSKGFPWLVPVIGYVVAGSSWILWRCLESASAAQIERLNREGFAIAILGTDGQKVFYGGANLKWNLEVTAKLEDGRYCVGEFLSPSLTVLPEVLPESLRLSIVVSGDTKCNDFHVLGLALNDGPTLLFSTEWTGLIGVDGQDARVLRSFVQYDIAVSVCDGLRRAHDILERFPKTIPVRVLVAVPQEKQTPTRHFILMGGLVVGPLMAISEKWDVEERNAQVKAAVQRLLDKNLVRDEASGMTLGTLCQNYGWELGLLE